MSEPNRLRADAARNRDKIIATARVAFAEHGLNTSLDEIAKHAGVGSGTLYRHFPTRDNLVTAVFLERITEHLAALERARRHEDAWEGFAGFVRETCLAQANDRGMADLFAIGHRSRELRALRTRAYNGFTELIDRAKTSGALRTDFSPEDVLLLLMATAGIVRHTGSTAPGAVDRFVALALDGFRAQGATPAPGPITPRTMALRLREATRDSTKP
jgi:AcrR family transcriptional regulator